MTLDSFKIQILPLKDKLYRFALRILGNHAVAEDVVQEVMIKIWKDRENLGGIKNLEAWCMRLTKNLSIDKTRGKHYNLNAIPDNFDMVQLAAGPQKLAELNDTVDKVKKLMTELPDTQRMAMQLRDVEGMTYKEIAEILEIQLDQVKVNIYRARKYIRLKLIKEESYGL